MNDSEWLSFDLTFPKTDGHQNTEKPITVRLRQHQPAYCDKHPWLSLSHVHTHHNLKHMHIYEYTTYTEQYHLTHIPLHTALPLQTHEHSMSTYSNTHTNQQMDEKSHEIKSCLKKSIIITLVHTHTLQSKCQRVYVCSVHKRQLGW